MCGVVLSPVTLARPLYCLPLAPNILTRKDPLLCGPLCRRYSKMHKEHVLPCLQGARAAARGPGTRQDHRADAPGKHSGDVQGLAAVECQDSLSHTDGARADEDREGGRRKGVSQAVAEQGGAGIATGEGRAGELSGEVGCGNSEGGGELDAGRTTTERESVGVKKSGVRGRKKGKNGKKGGAAERPSETAIGEQAQAHICVYIYVNVCVH